MEIVESIFYSEFRKYIFCFAFSENSILIEFHWCDFFHDSQKNPTVHIQSPSHFLQPNHRQPRSIKGSSTLRESLPILIAEIRNYLLSKVNYENLIIIENVPSYDTLLLNIDLDMAGIKETQSVIESHLNSFFSDIKTNNSQYRIFNKNQNEKPNIIIPTYYGKEAAWDTDHICQTRGISVDTLIKEHTQKAYTVCAVGFSPGFAYLGFLPQKIACPRKIQPRIYVPVGAVGIAEEQTGIYPIESPGGWNIIGRTYQTLINHSNLNNPNFLQVGDRVQFKSISKELYLEHGGQLTDENGNIV